MRANRSVSKTGEPIAGSPVCSQNMLELFTGIYYHVMINKIISKERYNTMKKHTVQLVAGIMAGVMLLGSVAAVVTMIVFGV